MNAANTVTFGANSSVTVNAPGIAFSDVIIEKGTRSVTIPSSLNVGGQLVLRSVGSLNTGTIAVTGDVFTEDTAIGGSATVSFTGPSNQLFRSTASSGIGVLPSVRIEKTGGTLSIPDTVGVYLHWTYVSGNLDL